MKKLVFTLCLLLIPAISQAALCSGNSYKTFFFSSASEGVATGTIAFSEENVLKQGVISIDYVTGDIGTGSYTSRSPISISCTLDFYGSNSYYLSLSFKNIFTTGITIIGIGQFRDVRTDEISAGIIFGIFSGRIP